MFVSSYTVFPYAATWCRACSSDSVERRRELTTLILLSNFSHGSAGQLKPTYRNLAFSPHLLSAGLPAAGQCAERRSERIKYSLEGWNRSLAGWRFDSTDTGAAPPSRDRTILFSGRRAAAASLDRSKQTDETKRHGARLGRAANVGYFDRSRQAHYVQCSHCRRR